MLPTLSSNEKGSTDHQNSYNKGSIFAFFSFLKSPNTSILILKYLKKHIDFSYYNNQPKSTKAIPWPYRTLGVHLCNWQLELYYGVFSNITRSRPFRSSNTLCGHRHCIIHLALVNWNKYFISFFYTYCKEATWRHPIIHSTIQLDEASKLLNPKLHSTTKILASVDNTTSPHILQNQSI